MQSHETRDAEEPIDEEQPEDLEPTVEESRDVKGGMTKQEFINRVADRSGLTIR